LVQKEETFFYKIYNNLESENKQISFFEDNKISNLNDNEKFKIEFSNFDRHNYSTDQDVDVIIRNGYPVTKYHFLFLPFYLENRPQYLDDEKIIYRVTDIIRYFNQNNDEDLVMGYNSKGASSSINSLHFQMISLSGSGDAVKKSNLWIMKEKCNVLENIYETENIQIFYCEKENLLSFFKIKFVDNETEYLEGENNSELSESFEKIEKYLNEKNLNQQNTVKTKKMSTLQKQTQLEKYSKLIFQIIKVLNSMNIPYNIIFFKNETYIFPRHFETKFRDKWIGVNELLGLILIYTKDIFNSFNAEKFIDTLRDFKLDDKTLCKIKEDVLLNFSLQKF
jgi:hypothetical protein